MNQKLKVGRQVSRFSLVGISNTAVDFIATNIFYFLLAPDDDSGLLLVSIIACLIATANSFVLNSRWTFAEVSDADHSLSRFLATAGVGMLVNTAIFLFLMRHLPLSGLTDDYVALNLARFGGVVAAMGVTFCGYRLWAFAPSLATRRRTADDDLQLKAEFSAGPILILMAVALATRLVFLWMAPVIYGDAVNYAWVARLTASGHLETVDLFWHSLFDFWQVLFVWLGAGQYAAPVLASLIPGVLLVWPVALITWRLYGNRAAGLSAALVALHPRLVEYSLNGYAESFYMLGATWATYGLVILAREPRRLTALLAAGLGLSAWILVRNEALLFAAIAIPLALLSQRHMWREIVRSAVCVAIIVSTLVVAYAFTNLVLWGEPGLVQKGSNLAREHVEMLDPHEAARETYGVTAPVAQQPDATAIVRKLAKRWPGNIRYTAERLPGMLLSPIILFALLLPILGPRRSSSASPTWPVILLAAWPIAFYPLIQLEPRMLFPTLIGAIIFGSAGALLAGQRLAGLVPRHRTLVQRAPGVVTLLLLLPLIPLLAWHSGSERGFHREVGVWLAETLPPNVQIVGDGYGYVSASAFWAGRRAEPRMWTDDKKILANSVGDNAVLILYERYLREANPELLSSLDDGLPGMIRIVEFDFPRIGRVQAWRHIDVVEHVREKRRGTVGVVDSISQRNILKRASTPANALIPGDEI